MSKEMRPDTEKNSAHAQAIPYIEAIFVCSTCGKKYQPLSNATIKRTIIAEQQQRPIFCSQSCSKKYTRKLNKIEKSCIDCGKVFPAGVHNAKRCAECFQKEKLQAAKNHRNKLKEEHRCTACGTPLPEEYEWLQCRPCLDKRYNSTGKKKGFCRICHTPVNKLQVLCPEHFRTEQNAKGLRYQQKEQARLKALHCCTECKQPLEENYPHSICQACSRKRTNRQPGRCSVCGKELLPSYARRICPSCTDRRAHKKIEQRLKNTIAKAENPTI